MTLRPSSSPSPPLETARPGDEPHTGLKRAWQAVTGWAGTWAARALEPVDRPVMSCAWKDLVVANYEVDPAVLQPYVPAGLELDSWKGKTVMSVVGLSFEDTKALGVPVPGQQEFEQLNLRFYVKDEDDQRGVVFLKEIVPNHAMAGLCQTLYNENYHRLPMAHERPEAGEDGTIGYLWNDGNRWNRLEAEREGPARPTAPGSLEEFVLEHYVGFTEQRDGQTLAYEVEHPPWRIFDTHNPVVDIDAAGLYGQELGQYLERPPLSVVVCEGSAVDVHAAKRAAGGGPSSASV